MEVIGNLLCVAMIIAAVMYMKARKHEKRIKELEGALEHIDSNTHWCVGEVERM